MALFQKYDPRAEMFDPTISAMKDAGLIEHMHRRRLPHLGMQEQINLAKERKLEVKHFSLPMIFLSTGFVFAVVAVIVEKSMKKTHHSRKSYKPWRKFLEHEI